VECKEKPPGSCSLHFLIESKPMPENRAPNNLFPVATTLFALQNRRQFSNQRPVVGMKLRLHSTPLLDSEPPSHSCEAPAVCLGSFVSARSTFSRMRSNFGPKAFQLAPGIVASTLSGLRGINFLLFLKIKGAARVASRQCRQTRFRLAFRPRLWAWAFPSKLDVFSVDGKLGRPGRTDK